MANFHVDRTRLDPNDPLLNVISALAGDITPEEARTRIIGSEKTYNIALLAPWHDITTQADADFAAKETIRILRTPNAAGVTILDTDRHAGEITFVGNCERALNGRSDDNREVVSRSMADPVDAKFFRTLCDAVHQEIKKTEFKDQLVIVSMGACTYESDDQGRGYKGIQGTIACRDEQHIFSNKSDNVYALQHFDFTPEAKKGMGEFSYYELDFVYHAAGDAIGSGRKRTTVDARDVMPPGTLSATAVTLLHDRSKAVSEGVDFFLSRETASAHNSCATSKKSSLSIVNHGTNPIGPAPPIMLLFAGNDPPAPSGRNLADDPGFLNRIGSLKPGQQKLLKDCAHYISSQPPGSSDALFAHWMFSLANISLADYSDYIFSAPSLDMSARARFQRSHAEMRESRLSNGLDREQEMSLMQMSCFSDDQQVEACNRAVNQHQAVRGPRYTTGIGEFSAELRDAINNLARRNVGAEASVATWITEVNRIMDVVLQNPQNAPHVPLEVTRPTAWRKGDVDPVRAANRLDDWTGADPGARRQEERVQEQHRLDREASRRGEFEHRSHR